MKYLTVSILFAVVAAFAADSAFASTRTCYNNSNPDYYLVLNVGSDGVATGAALYDQDWGSSGDGAEQTLRLISSSNGSSVYQVTSPAGTLVSLAVGSEIRIDGTQLSVTYQVDSEDYHCD